MGGEALCRKALKLVEKSFFRNLAENLVETLVSGPRALGNSARWFTDVNLRLEYPEEPSKPR